MKKIEPVANWRKGLHWISVQANILSQFMLGSWIFLRDQPMPSWAMGVLWAVLIVGLVGRFFKRKAKP
jgi:hypothetical protein